MSSDDNLLPFDGEVYLLENALSPIIASQYFKDLYKNIPWSHDVIQMFGKTITTKRRVAWYSDPGLDYTYSGTKKLSQPWTKPLVELKEIAEDLCETEFNSCLLNLYQDGSEGMGWHADDEKDLLKDGVIASISLGAERRFSFRHKTEKMTLDITLKDGSLLIMKGQTQRFWKHQLPVAKRIKEPRINLTFRQMQRREI
jgi:alkylated DNA repair dioxygenase AlkB